ncbi:MAG: ferredoxin [Candidatus Komeilibacteria bacterium]
MSNPIVDQNKCTGCGTCIALCPQVFNFNKEGKSAVVDSSACAHCDCQLAIDSCPSQAISWQEE